MLAYCCCRLGNDPTMRKGCVINFWRSLSALSASSTSISSSSSRYVNESERVFEMKRMRRKTSRPAVSSSSSNSSYGGFWSKKNKKVSYGGLQAAYIKNCGLVVESYQMMEQGDDIVFFPWDDLLREYIMKKRMVEASRIFDIMPERSTVSWHVLILGYIKIGRMRHANKIFKSSPKEGTVWESMMCGYARHGMHKLAREFFLRMPRENMLTRQMQIAGFYIGSTSESIEKTGNKGNRMEVDHNRIATWNLLIEGNFFAGMKEEARWIFDNMVNRNAMSWNLMLAAHNRIPIPALYTSPVPKMPIQLRNSHSWNLMMAARVSCNKGIAQSDKLFEEALTIFHIHMPETQRDMASWNTLIYLLVEQEKLDEARFYLDNMQPDERNPHSWGLMMAGYLEADMFDEAKNIFFDKNIRVCDDLHSWVLILGWFVKKKNMVNEARRFLVNNVPERPLSFYSIASACIKHGFREESKLVLESMQATMHTNLNVQETITFMEEKLKEKRGPYLIVHSTKHYALSFTKRGANPEKLSDPKYQDYVRRVKDRFRPMFEYEPHSFSNTFLQILDSDIDANGDCSHIFLKGSCDCCGLLQI